jgi:uncharacterized damage-inducible protein DinB
MAPVSAAYRSENAMNEALIAELEQESMTTRPFLESVPQNKIEWRPHKKSMTLGQLALHVASLPASITDIAKLRSLDAAAVDFTPASLGSVAELLPTLAVSIDKARDYLESLDADTLMQDWTLHSRGDEIFTVPRVALLRSLMFNHWYHHRGQLSVYLRLLDVPVPIAYGRTADMDPFE